MAIKMDYNDRKYGQITNAYAKIIYISCDKHTIYYSIQVYLNKDISDNDTEVEGRLKDLHIAVINNSCPHNLESSLNIIQQSYDHFKGLFPSLNMEDV